MYSSETATMSRISRNWSGYMHTHRCAMTGVAVTLIALVAAACTDPTVAPTSTVTGANYFNDPGSYKAFLAKAYAGLAVGGQNGGDGSTDIQGIDGGFSQYMRLYWEMEELPTDEAVIAWGDQTLPELNTQGWNASNTFVNAMYYRVFFQVGMANEFLRETSDAKLASRGVSGALLAQVHTYRAEARFLRALSLWHGLDFFGDIPLLTENNPLGSIPQQSTRTAIYNYVVSELTAIRDSLPLPGGASTYGRATGPAADMLLAELYLNADVYTGTPNYAGALTKASAVIGAGYTLAPNYFNNFQADNNTSPEIVFAVPEDGIRTQTYGSTNFIIHASCGESMSNATYGVDGCWWGLRLKPSGHDLYAAGDLRASQFFTGGGQTVAVASISTFKNGIPNPKFTNKTSSGATGSNPSFADTDFPMFRLGEAYLIYAEAQVRGGGGDTTTALLYVNRLRLRAFANDSTKMIVGNQLTLPFLLAERGRELMWEGHRRTDLVRFGAFTGGTYLWAWKGANAYGGDSTAVATDAHFNLYPIPANELIANPNLHQNTGY
jgi:starch-binding outer membrane protein, SusD/RagB family